MTNINGKWIRREHFDTEEDRKKAMRDWHRRYYEIFRSDDQFCNWLKLPWNDKPVTPKYLKEYEQQKAIGYESNFIEGEKDCSNYMKGIFDDWQAQGITSVLHEKKGGYAFNKDSIKVLKVIYTK